MARYSLFFVIIAAAFIYGCQPAEHEGSSTDAETTTAEGSPTVTIEPDSTDNEDIVPPAEEIIEIKTPTVDEVAVQPDNEDITEVAPEPVDDEDPAEKNPEPVTLPDEKPEVEPKVEPEIEKPEPKVARPAFYENCKHIFATYVDKHGNVDYKTLRRKRADLIKAVRSFNDVDSKKYIFWSKEEKTALWINAYNIFTLMVVIENYPIQPKWWILNYPKNSIFQIQKGDTWTKEYFKVMGIEYNLNEIERELLLQKFKDPRICFALTYATQGGAFLRNEPYYPEKLEQQLNEQTKRFLKSPRGMKIDRNNKKIYLSAIFTWYRKDFADKYGDAKKFRDRSPQNRAYLNFAADYASPEDILCFESDDYTVDFLKYDWALNEQQQ